MSRLQRQSQEEDEEEELQEQQSFASKLWKWGSVTAGVAAGAYMAYEFVKYENHRQLNYAYCENKFVSVEELLDDPELLPGVLIEFVRIKYQHWAVYIGNGKVIHLTNNGRVQICSLKSVANTDKCRVNNHSTAAEARGLKPRGSLQDIVKYAEARIGQPYTYHVETYNCEHFATECFYNFAFSEQEKMLQGAVVHRLVANTTAAIRTFE